MIRTVAVCPYCGDVSAGVDDDGPAFVLAPDRADDRPCPHLAFLCASLGAWDPALGCRDPGGSGHWLWELGAGLRALPAGPWDALAEYVDGLMCGTVPGDSLAAGEYRVAGGTAGCREAVRAGSGEFPLRRRRGRPLGGVLDGHGLYAPAPAALVAAVRRAAGAVRR